MKAYSVMLEGEDSGRGYYVVFTVTAENEHDAIKISTDYAKTKENMSIIGTEEINEIDIHEIKVKYGKINKTEVLEISGRSFWEIEKN